VQRLRAQVAQPQLSEERVGEGHGLQLVPDADLENVHALAPDLEVQLGARPGSAPSTPPRWQARRRPLNNPWAARLPRGEPAAASWTAASARPQPTPAKACSASCSGGLCSKAQGLCRADLNTGRPSTRSAQFARALPLSADQRSLDVIVRAHAQSRGIPHQHGRYVVPAYEIPDRRDFVTRERFVSHWR
jgi:hypothetical protein